MLNRRYEGESTATSRSGFRFGFELDVAFGDFNRVLDVFAVILFANLLGLLLHEGGEGIDATANRLSGFLLGRYQSVVEAFDLLALGLVHAVQREMWRGCCCGGGNGRR